MVDIFNKFFTNIGSDLVRCNSMQDANINDFLNEPTVNSMFLK